MYNQRHDLRQMNPHPYNNNAGSESTDFYNTLVHYQPLCAIASSSRKSFSVLHAEQQRQETYPTFLVNNGWWRSFICIIIMDALFILTYLKFVFDTRIKYVDNNNSQQPVIQTYQKSRHFNTMLWLSIISLVLINISYLLTQFLNPGVRNLAEISQQQLDQGKKIQFCQKCNQYKTEKFTHCSDCEVCIWNYDHHCGFFDKCIGGRAQFWAFLLFLASVTAGFLILLGCMTVQLGGTV